MSDSYWLGLILALTGGCLDAYTYLVRGGVFANAQTGNIVLLGVSLARGDLSRTTHYLVPILTFVLGVLLAESIRLHNNDLGRLHWRQVVLMLELAVLAAVSFVPMGEADVAVNVAVTFVCALQMQSFRKVDGNVMATTMCTGNLRSSTELLCRYRARKDPALLHRALEYYGVILCFAVGAGLGALLCLHLKERAVLLPCVLMAVGVVMMFRTRRER